MGLRRELQEAVNMADSFVDETEQAWNDERYDLETISELYGTLVSWAEVIAAVAQQLEDSVEQAIQARVKAAEYNEEADRLVEATR